MIVSFFRISSTYDDLYRTLDVGLHPFKLFDPLFELFELFILFDRDKQLLIKSRLASISLEVFSNCDSDDSSSSGLKCKVL